MVFVHERHDFFKTVNALICFFADGRRHVGFNDNFVRVRVDGIDLSAVGVHADQVVLQPLVLAFVSRQFFFALFHYYHY